MFKLHNNLFLRESIFKSQLMQMEGLNKWVKTGQEELKSYDVLTIAMKKQDLMKNNW